MPINKAEHSQSASQSLPLGFQQRIGKQIFGIDIQQDIYNQIPIFPCNDNAVACVIFNALKILILCQRIFYFLRGVSAFKVASDF
jgi:hypothetical protein